MKYLTLMAIPMFLAGCATTNQATVAEYAEKPTATLPPVTVFLQHPLEEFQKNCEEFDRASTLQHCRLNRLDLGKFASELSNADVFEEVLYANQDVPYQIRVTTGVYNTEGGDDLASAAFAGATLMLAPMIISADIKVDAALYWHEYKLKQFQYNLSIEFQASLLSVDQDTDRDAARSVASHILRDVQSEELFSATYLATAIHSSDYEKDLSVPEVMGDYAQQEMRVFNNPLCGACVLYQKDTALADYIEISVYPIRAGRWQDEKNVLEKEIENLKKDMELSNKENAIELLRQSDNEVVIFPHPNATIDAVMFTTEVMDRLSNEYACQTYLMIMEDKFFRVQHTALNDVVSRAEVEDAVSQLVKSSEVPQESLFMAKLRKQLRHPEAL